MSWLKIRVASWLNVMQWFHMRNVADATAYKVWQRKCSDWKNTYKRVWYTTRLSYLTCSRLFGDGDITVMRHVMGRWNCSLNGDALRLLKARTSNFNVSSSSILNLVKFGNARPWWEKLRVAYPRVIAKSSRTCVEEQHPHSEEKNSTCMSIRQIKSI